MWKDKIIRGVTIVMIGYLAGCTQMPSTGPEDLAPSNLADLSLEEKAGQMFMVRYSGRFYSESAYTYRQVKRLISENHLGGVIQFFGTVHGTVANLNELQRMASIPLLVAADYERGVGQQLDGGTLFPTNMALAATGDSGLAYKQGMITAKEARAIGVHVTFAPVMDVNSNPDNPIINFRSYGDSPGTVAQFGAEFIRGAQEHGLWATAKHFPGHGNTGTDSHSTLPVITADREVFEVIDLAPFKAAIDAGVKVIMVGHIAVPELDKSRLPATLSHTLNERLLRQEYGFSGLIVTDAMEMGGITEAFWAGEAAIRAIEAGSDLILLPIDVDRAMESVIEAVRSGRISAERIDESVSRILAAKRELGLWQERTVSLETAQSKLGQTASRATASEVARKSITMVKDDNKLIPVPVAIADTLSHILLATDEGMLAYSSTFRSVVARIHGNVKTRFFYQSLTGPQIAEIIESVTNSDYVLCTLLIRVRMNIGTVTIDESHRRLISELQSLGKPVVVTSFGSPYVTDVDGIGTYLCAYGYGSISQHAMADALFGAASITGKLPVDLSRDLRRGDGLRRISGDVLPESVLGPDFSEAKKILAAAVGDSIFPGAQVVITQGGEVLWSHEVGRHTYDPHSPPVTENTIYDAASLTKVVATTPVVMKLVEQKKLPLDEPVNHFLPEFEGGNKEMVTIRQMLTHSAGLKPFDEFPLGTKGSEILAAILDFPLESTPGEMYRYSDFGPILLGEVAGKVTSRTLDDLAASYVFRPLGMTSTMFNPDPSLLGRVAPTEVDETYGRGLVHGIVHDERAWQLGGVAGHAGLFSTAGDLARYAQMMMDGGFFGGRRYFKRSTISEFVRKQEMPPGSERALGWDTPSEEGSLAGDYFSLGSFGHTGFTGTSIWIDPNERIAVILLTNHVHPSRGNTPSEFADWKTEMRKVRRDFYNSVMRVILQLDQL